MNIVHRSRRKQELIVRNMKSLKHKFIEWHCDMSRLLCLFIFLNLGASSHEARLTSNSSLNGAWGQVIWYNRANTKVEAYAEFLWEK
jgi:hypothetical protein